VILSVFGRFVARPFAGHAVLAFDPFTEVDEPAPFGTERTIRNVFPLDWLTAGWTLHES